MIKVTENVTKEVTNYFENKIKYASLTDEAREKINDKIQETVEQMIEVFTDCDLELDYIIENQKLGVRDFEQEARDCENFVTKYQLGGAF